MGATSCPAQCARDEGQSPPDCTGGLTFGLRGCSRVEAFAELVPSCCSKNVSPPRTRNGRFSTSLARKVEAEARRSSTAVFGEDAGIDGRPRRLSAKERRESGIYTWLPAEINKFEIPSAFEKYGDLGKKSDRETIDMFMDIVRSGSFQETVDVVEQHWSVVLRMQDARGRTALMIAAAAPMRNAPEKLDFLLQAKMDVEAKDNSGWTALLHAARCGNVETAELLIKVAANVNAKTEDGKTPLLLATIDGADQLVVDLVKAGAALNHRDKKEWNALYYACEYERLEMVRWFLKIGVDPLIRTKEGVTPVMICAEVGSLQIAKVLRKHGADLNSVDRSGNSALMIALQKRHEEFVAFLLDRECDVTLTNTEGRTAFDIAEEANLQAIVARMFHIARQFDDEGKRGDN